MADFFITQQPTAVWEANNPTLQANELGVCSDIRNGVETDSLLSKLGNGVDNWNALPAYNPGGHKVYRALLTQPGTDAPVATVLENSLGGTVVWTRNTAASYHGTLAGAFPANKVFILVNGMNDGTVIAYYGERLDNDIVNLANAVGDNNTMAVQIIVCP